MSNLNNYNNDFVYFDDDETELTNDMYNNDITKVEEVLPKFDMIKKIQTSDDILATTNMCPIRFIIVQTLLFLILAIIYITWLKNITPNSIISLSVIFTCIIVMIFMI